MKRLCVTVLAAAALALVDVPGVGAATCRDLLGSNGYDCSVLNENNSAFTACITTSPAPPDEVAMTYDPGADSWTGTCSCDATGSISKPNWEQAKTFLCALDHPLNGPLAVSGKATERGIANGRLTFGNGFSGRFQCTKRTTPCPP